MSHQLNGVQHDASLHAIFNAFERLGIHESSTNTVAVIFRGTTKNIVRHPTFDLFATATCIEFTILGFAILLKTIRAGISVAVTDRNYDELVAAGDTLVVIDTIDAFLLDILTTRETFNDISDVRFQYCIALAKRAICEHNCDSKACKQIRNNQNCS